MGGCCSTDKGVQQTPAAGYYTTTIEEQAPLPTNHGTTLIISPGLLVSANLDSSIPDTYRSPPAPVPYNVVIAQPQNPPRAEKFIGDKGVAAAKAADSGAADETTAGGKTEECLVKCVDLKVSDGKEQSVFDIEEEKEFESDPKKSIEPFKPPEECPTCLEEYDSDNPKIITKCEHHFHLACILEWLERSETCPVCSKEMVFDQHVS